MTITKSVCEKYTVELTDMPSWAEIAIDESTGMVAIHSDYGNWAYGWPRHGRKSLKHFLVETGRDHHYIMEKFGGAQTWFDLKKTANYLCERVTDLWGDREITALTAENIIKVIREAESDCNNSGELFCDRLRDSVEVVRLFNPLYEYMHCDHPPQLRLFMERLWMPFVAHLKSVQYPSVDLSLKR